MDSDLNIFLNGLRDAINNDPNQFNRAKTDSMYNNLRPQVDALLEDLIQEKKIIAKKEYRDLEYAAQKMKKWFDSNYSNSDDNRKYDEVLVGIHNAKNKIKDRNYVSYVDAINIMVAAKKIIFEIQKSIENNLDSMKKELDQTYNNNNKLLISDIYNNKKKLIKKKKINLYIKIIICWGLLIALAYIMFIYDNEDFDILWGIVCMTLIISALGALLDDSGNYIGQFIILIIPSFIVFIVACVIFLVIIFVARFLLGETMSDFLEYLIFLIPIFGLIFGPFLARDEDIVSKLLEIEKNILAMKNDENAKNKHIKYLHQKIQIANEAL